MSRGLSIRAANLSKSYSLGRDGALRHAVRDLSFTFAEGERIGVIGRNGAGKSTLLQMIAGISEPSEGALDVSGHVTAVFTLGIGLRDDLSGLVNIYVEGELQGRTREQTAAVLDEIVEFAELGDFIGMPVRTYSTGMKARLAFSTIVHIDPEILIIDEALSVGDYRFAAKATRKMRELAAKGKILVLVSHSMGAIVDMCSRCLWIEAGTVRMDGAPADVTQAYLNEVRRADEARLYERFRAEVVDESLVRGWSVDAIEMLGAAGEPLGALITAEPSRLRATLSGPPRGVFDAVLKIKRLDGLLVMTSRARDGGTMLGFGQEGSCTLTVDLGEVVLNQGSYRVEFELHDGEVATARRSLLFQVLNPRPHKGAHPVLIYPFAMTVHPLQQ